MPITSRLFIQSTILLLLVGLVALAAIVGTVFWLGVHTNASFANVLTARTLRASMIDLRSSLQDAETGQRGYLLTGRDDYLHPYTAAVAAIPDQQKRLDALVGRDTAIADLWTDTKAVIAGKLDEIGQTIALKQAGKGADALAIVNSDRGKTLMDLARNDFGKIIDLAEGRISTAVADQQWSTVALAWVAGIGAFVIVIVAGGSTFTAFRYTQELGTARDELDAANAGLEQRVVERTADLVEANEEIQRFAYVVTHDLRAPLVNIMGFTAELETSVADIKSYLDGAGGPATDPTLAAARRATDTDLPESIGFIRSSSRKMDALINAILKLAREGGRKMKPEAVELKPMLEAAVAAVHHQITAAEGEAEVASTVPMITTDRLALEQIVGNLLDNAVKYRSLSRPLRISLKARAKGRDRVEIEIADNGRGIAPQDHERVFELFRRAGVQDQAGEGIGLAYVRRSVRNLGGDIKLQSELDKGTTFIVTLPRSFQPIPGSAAK